MSFGAEPNVVAAGPYTFFAGSRSEPLFVDFGGVLEAFNWGDGKNFTDLKDVDPYPWTGNDTFAPYNVFGIVLELPTSELGASPSLGIWARASVRTNGKLDHVDRAGHPTIASFFNKAVIDEAGLLPDMLRYDPSKPAEYPNGRVRTDHVVAARMAMISNNSVPSDGLGPHGRPARGVPVPRHAAPESTPASPAAGGLAHTAPLEARRSNPAAATLRPGVRGTAERRLITRRG